MGLVLEDYVPSHWSSQDGDSILQRGREQTAGPETGRNSSDLPRPCFSDLLPLPRLYPLKVPHTPRQQCKLETKYFRCELLAVGHILYSYHNHGN